LPTPKINYPELLLEVLHASITVKGISTLRIIKLSAMANKNNITGEAFAEKLKVSRKMCS
jgi:hypothetical protein